MKTEARMCGAIANESNSKSEEALHSSSVTVFSDHAYFHCKGIFQLLTLYSPQFSEGNRLPKCLHSLNLKYYLDSAANKLIVTDTFSLNL